MTALERAITLPFSFDSFGSVANTTSQEKIWVDRVRSAVATNLRERVFLPEYGTVIASTVFDSLGDAEELIQEEVSRVFVRDLPLLTLSSVTSTYEEFSGIINCEIVFELPNKEETALSIGVATIYSDAPITEELR
jgi:phage baseplate assembly protein W